MTKIKKQFWFALISLLALFYACEKEPITPDNTFYFFYHFYNEGDTSLKRVVAFCSTFYPKEELTSWISRDKGRDEYYYDPEHLLHDFDSLIVETDIKTYPGCVYSYVGNNCKCDTRLSE